MLQKFMDVFGEMGNDFKLSDYYWIGEVIDNADPEMLGRVKVDIPELFEGIPKEELPWIHRLMPVTTGGGGSSVNFVVPGIGTKLLIIFPFNNPYIGIYLGEMMSKGHSFSEVQKNYPESFGFQNKTGDKWWYDMKEGTFDFQHHSGTHVTIKKDGTTLLKVLDNMEVEIKGNLNIKVDGNTTLKSGGDIKLQGSNIHLN